ncbi:hypothetical protein [Flavobacterium sp. IMCC34518]|uniref:tetratricopeptide repeat protein n=1 Tax=Flavobacterium sp. IMCC34518 TaxID=3003623 RepID=UPI002482EF71|nr:hypothetical protein [Flavobacterium sp. IMCC34518]
MKNQLLVCIIIIGFIPLNCWSQKNPLNQKKISESNNTSIFKNTIEIPNRKVKYYHVEEIIVMKFGSRKTIYNVSDSKLIQTFDLGPNNIRIITPIFENEDANFNKAIKSNALKKTDESSMLSSINSTEKATTTDDLQLENKSIIIPSQIQKEQPNESLTALNSLNAIESSTKPSITAMSKEEEDKISYIDIIKTYEGVAEKGYATLDILKKLANSFYFNNELEKAEKYYTKLFNKTSDLEPEYYYRYSVALKSIGQDEKANDFLQKFKQLSNATAKE